MKLLKLFAGLAILFSTHSYSQDFTWVHGNTSSGISATYGTMGVPSSANSPGARHGCGKWIDASGNLWLFGGEGYGSGTSNSWLSDLWKYDVGTNQWTWVNGPNTSDSPGTYGTLGVSSPANEPGAREFCVSWTDANGRFWMFGGDGFATSSQTTVGKLGDFWMYDPAINEWTWMGGFNTPAQNGVYGSAGIPSATNMPGGRAGAIGWTDATGSLWLFGGRGFAATGIEGYLNDLWKYSVSTNQWTWVNGANVIDQNGSYGSIGVPATGNFPGSRYFSVTWTSSTGSLYLFGGAGFDGSGGIGRLNDLWKFDPVAGSWTWINGSAAVNPVGVYGTQNVASSATSPGGRLASASWKDPYGNLWLFGGTGLASAPVTAELNDLFKYDIAANMWTWVKGATVADQNGTYGTQGVAAATNVPGARTFNTYWTRQNMLWLYGGEGLDASSPNHGNMNDLWRFKVPCNPDSITIAPGHIICSGSSFTLNAVNGGSTTVWYDSPVSTNSLAGGSMYTSSSLTASGTQSVYSFFAEANACVNMPRASVSITVNPVPSLSVSVSQASICKGETATFTVSGASSYTWTGISPSSTNAAISVSPATTSTYQVSGSGSNGCKVTSSIILNVNDCLGLGRRQEAGALHLYPNPAGNVFTLELNQLPVNTHLSIYNNLGQKVAEQLLPGTSNVIRTALSPGVYHYQVNSSHETLSSGRLVIE